MFIIKPFKPEDWEHALFILSYYHVSVGVRSNGEQSNTTYMVVEELPEAVGTDHDNDLRLAEACFQMNWHTHNGHLCPECIDHSDVYDTCGHLAFSHPINPAF
jgi:hypothetical protein